MSQHAWLFRGAVTTALTPKEVSNPLPGFGGSSEEKSLKKDLLLRCREAKQTGAPRVIIIVLNWNGRDDTLECLESLRGLTYPNFGVLLVDNGSSDGSAQSVRSRIPGIQIVETGVNLGYAGGNNVGIRKALESGGEYVLILNNDTVVHPDMLSTLVDSASSDSRVGVVGPTVYYYSDRDRVQSAGGRFSWFSGRPVQWKSKEDLNNRPSSSIEVGLVGGCCMLVSAELVRKIGLFDEFYFAHWEEIDWEVRAKEAGFKMMYVPGARIWHKSGATSSKTAGLREYYNARNRFYFMRKHASRSQQLTFLLYYFVIDFWFTSLILVLRHRGTKGFVRSLEGTLDGLHILKESADVLPPEGGQA